MSPSPLHPESTHEHGQDGRPPSHPVTITVNNQAVELPDHTATGREIKAAAIAQGVRIEMDFILVEELGKSGRTRVIGDDDPVRLSPESGFSANDGDEDS